MQTNRAEAIDALAAYLTSGARVTANSIALEIGGARKAEADAFFALRNVFGVNGYADADQARTAIAAVLAD